MFVPLDGPCASEEVANYYTTYREETRHAIMTGEKPVNFATRNRTPNGIEAKRTKKTSAGKISQLGERILGITSWDVPMEDEEEEQE